MTDRGLKADRTSSGISATERLTEEFWERYRRLQAAVEADDSPLVHRREREFTASLTALVEHQALDAAEQQAQFGALLRLLHEEADDASRVRSNVALIETLLRRYITVRTRAANHDTLPALSGPIRDGVLDVGLLDVLPERVCVVTTDYRYLYANATEAARLDRKAHELVGRHVRDVVGADRFDAAIKTNLDRCFSGETVESANARERDGRIVVVRRRLTPCYADSRVLVGALVIIQEGPDRRRGAG